MHAGPLSNLLAPAFMLPSADLRNAVGDLRASAGTELVSIAAGRDAAVQWMKLGEMDAGNAVRDMRSLGEEIVRPDQRARARSPRRRAISPRIFLHREHAHGRRPHPGLDARGRHGAHLDAIGNVCGRYEGERPGLPCLMLGSHYDTVRDAGKWDGPLGVITRDRLRRRSEPARPAAAVRDRGHRLCRRGGRALCLDAARQPRGRRHF